MEESLSGQASGARPGLPSAPNHHSAAPSCDHTRRDLQIGSVGLRVLLVTGCFLSIVQVLFAKELPSIAVIPAANSSCVLLIAAFSSSSFLVSSAASCSILLLFVSILQLLQVHLVQQHLISCHVLQNHYTRDDCFCSCHSAAALCPSKSCFICSTYSIVFAFISTSSVNLSVLLLSVSLPSRFY